MAGISWAEGQLIVARQAVATILRDDDQTFAARWNTIEELRLFVAAELNETYQRWRRLHPELPVPVEVEGVYDYEECYQRTLAGQTEGGR